MFCFLNSDYVMSSTIFLYNFCKSNPNLMKIWNVLKNGTTILYA